MAFQSPFDQPSYRPKAKKKAKARKKVPAKKAKKKVRKKKVAKKRAPAKRSVGKKTKGKARIQATCAKCGKMGWAGEDHTIDSGTGRKTSCGAMVWPYARPMTKGKKTKATKAKVGKIKVGDKLLGGKVVDVTKVGPETVVALDVPKGHKFAHPKWKGSGTVTLRGEGTLSLVDMNDARDLDFARLRGWHDGPPVLLEIPENYNRSRLCRWATGHYWLTAAGGGHNFRPSFKFKHARTGTVWRMDTRVRAKGSRLKRPTKTNAEKQRKSYAKALGYPASSSWKTLAGSRYPGKGIKGDGPVVQWTKLKNFWKAQVWSYLTKPKTEFSFKIGRKEVGAATLDSLTFHLTAGHVNGKAADDTAIHYALWELVKEGKVQHTTGEPVWFVPRVTRV